MSLIELAHQREKEWEDYNLPSTYLEGFVFQNLLEKNTSEYVLYELFSKKAIQAVADLGAMLITAKRQGRSVWEIGPGGGEVGEEKTNSYEKLFSLWQKAGWVELNIDESANGVHVMVI
ncbi:hypothetical protein SAMN02745857_02744 [Andreprevotia lacus DSM 23236]|jgi:hypothetical protein|uniref:Uncharacterized protein n=1 Tax=Andreprevotia lacus DSM 23236 TaxID=1121001 RepID=A0A1W1XTA1_9NEIS|nr:hypothetical protein [Andreprevotia lacus]SMC27189.1 hypothetical protein SAMN02745857_02744 [Andreprevotia lacus DSM 23236]